MVACGWIGSDWDATRLFLWREGWPVADNYIDGHLKVRMYVLSGAHLRILYSYAPGILILMQ